MGSPKERWLARLVIAVAGLLAALYAQNGLIYLLAICAIFGHFNHPTREEASCSSRRTRDSSAPVTRAGRRAVHALASPTHPPTTAAPAISGVASSGPVGVAVSQGQWISPNQIRQARIAPSPELARSVDITADLAVKSDNLLPCG